MNWAGVGGGSGGGDYHFQKLISEILISETSFSASCKVLKQYSASNIYVIRERNTAS
jgi:hypothetical protein